MSTTGDIWNSKQLHSLKINISNKMTKTLYSLSK